VIINFRGLFARGFGTLSVRRK